MTEPNLRSVRIWDAPVRIFHWLMVLTFTGAWLTAESERWRLMHVTLGYTMAGLVVFRLLWGLVGTRHARFADFLRGPKAVARYLGSLVRGRPEHHAGHNPAGGWSIVALLALATLTVALGWAAYADLGGERLKEAHEVAANLMIGIIAIHVGGVLLGSWMHRENLVRAMITGRKQGDAAEGISNMARGVAAVLLVAVLGFWFVQWRDAPANVLTQAATHRHADEAGRQDD